MNFVLFSLKSIGIFYIFQPSAGHYATVQIKQILVGKFALKLLVDRKY